MPVHSARNGVKRVLVPLALVVFGPAFSCGTSTEVEPQLTITQGLYGQLTKRCTPAGCVGAPLEGAPVGWFDRSPFPGDGGVQPLPVKDAVSGKNGFYGRAAALALSSGRGYSGQWRFPLGVSRPGAPVIDLCQTCGMCCNGTLFNSVTLITDDLPKLQKYTQLELVVQNEQPTFAEPCPLHTGHSCSAYDDRPATCERYVCGLLRAVEKGELTEQEALLVIGEGKALVAEVKEHVAFEPGMPIAVSTWDDAPEEASLEARGAWDRAKWHLGRWFLGTVKDETPLVTPLPRRVTRASLFAKR